MLFYTGLKDKVKNENILYGYLLNNSWRYGITFSDVQSITTPNLDEILSNTLITSSDTYKILLYSFFSIIIITKIFKKIKG